MTKILKIKGDWQEVVDDCRATVKKPPLGHEPSAEFKRRILIAEHDPIRDIIVKFRWKDIPYWMAMHWKTHIWRGRTESQRNDRQDRYDRDKAPQDAPVTFTGDANAQHLIDTMRKRLCFMAAPETRACALDLKRTLRETEPELSDVLVPNCVYRFGCPEMAACPIAQGGTGLSYWALLAKRHPEVLTDDIQTRYDVYNAVLADFGGDGNG